MEAKELRIGNKVKQAHATITVLGVSRSYALCTDFNGHTCKCTYENLQGIPLTPEILKKCGFVENGEKHIKHKDEPINGFDIGFYVGDKDVYLFQTNNTSNTYYMGIDFEVQYLHQLQNIVHALTGTELTYTP